MTKEQILTEIRRTAAANGGVPLGWRRFATQTDIGYYDWFGKYWSRWNDAVREAGLNENRFPTDGRPIGDLVSKLVALTRELGRVPTRGDVLLARQRSRDFPSEKVLRRLGPKSTVASHVIAFCQSTPGNDDVSTLWTRLPRRTNATEADDDEKACTGEKGFVYLLRHGARPEYKIGRTYSPLRREGEVAIELPERITPIHYIETDDPSGVETYWHNRFATKRKQGEWFALSADDVRAFKRWKKIY